LPLWTRTTTGARLLLHCTAMVVYTAVVSKSFSTLRTLYQSYVCPEFLQTRHRLTQAGLRSPLFASRNPRLSVRTYATKPKNAMGEWYSSILPSMFPIALLASAVYTVRKII
jgi:hypothetical protein